MPINYTTSKIKTTKFIQQLEKKLFWNSEELTQAFLSIQKDLWKDIDQLNKDITSSQNWLNYLYSWISYFSDNLKSKTAEQENLFAQKQDLSSDLAIIHHAYMQLYREITKVQTKANRAPAQFLQEIAKREMQFLEAYEVELFLLKAITYLNKPPLETRALCSLIYNWLGTLVKTNGHDPKPLFNMAQYYSSMQQIASQEYKNTQVHLWLSKEKNFLSVREQIPRKLKELLHPFSSNRSTQTSFFGATAAAVDSPANTVFSRAYPF